VAIGGQQYADFTVDNSDPGYITVRVGIASALADSDTLNLAITGGTAVVPEFPAAGAAIAAAFAAITAAALVIKRMGLWT
jgi:hypothetical protein